MSKASSADIREWLRVKHARQQQEMHERLDEVDRQLSAVIEGQRTAFDCVGTIEVDQSSDFATASKMIQAFSEEADRVIANTIAPQQQRASDRLERRKMDKQVAKLVAEQKDEMPEQSVALQMMLAQSAAATAAAAAEHQAALEGRSSVGADDERTTASQHSSCLSQEHWKKLVHQVQQSRSTVDALTVKNVSSSEDESDVETEDAVRPAAEALLPGTPLPLPG